MIKMEETVNKVDMLLADKGLTQNCDEPTVRQMLLHLYTAIDIYRYMTQAEKNAAGSWFRAFENSFTLRNFLKVHDPRCGNETQRTDAFAAMPQT